MASIPKTVFKSESEKASIQQRLLSRQARWGDPEKNREKLIPLGLGPIDLAVWGLDGQNGDLILWIGEEKARKSTVVRNVIINIMTAPLPLIKPATVIDVLETGEPPDVVADALLCNLATRLLHSSGHRSLGACPLCKGECREMKLSSYFVTFSHLSDAQENALNVAAEEMMNWPLLIFGAGRNDGMTRNMARSKQRWDYLIEQGKMNQLVIDHLQQYSSLETILSDYEKQIRGLAEISDLVATNKIIAHIISQISLTSLRELRSGSTDKVDAAGGRKAAQEANLEFTIRKMNDNQVEIKITRTRRSGTLTVTLPIEKESGAQLAIPVLKGKSQD